MISKEKSTIDFFYGSIYIFIILTEIKLHNNCYSCNFTENQMLSEYMNRNVNNVNNICDFNHLLLITKKSQCYACHLIIACYIMPLFFSLFFQIENILCSGWNEHVRIVQPKQIYSLFFILRADVRVSFASESMIFTIKS